MSDVLLELSALVNAGSQGHNTILEEDRRSEEGRRKKKKEDHDVWCPVRVVGANQC